ncbi:hypothetical protein HanHA89_Chr01g0003101 [Helianthus annuus]|nr:hypothetical protein HanHA89_Chr01g0003101 [Helianthus annuus]
MRRKLLMRQMIILPKKGRRVYFLDFERDCLGYTLMKRDCDTYLKKRLLFLLE